VEKAKSMQGFRFSMCSPHASRVEVRRPQGRWRSPSWPLRPVCGRCSKP
jgi:hypothetical protein